MTSVLVIDNEPEVCCAGFGLIYSGGEGIQASLVTNYAGGRFLDMQNTIAVGSYVTADATLGYAFHGYTISINGYNLSDRREPVLRFLFIRTRLFLFRGIRVYS